MPHSLTVKAPAKLNLYLNITGRRTDGYHLLDSLFAFTALADELKLARSDSLELTQDGEFADGVPVDGGHLVLRAARLLAHHAAIEPRAAIHLVKRIPVAAGLGGGSADAAAALLGLNRLWRLEWPMERLHPLAAELGADVPACLHRAPILVRGIGDIIVAAPRLPSCGLLMVNPRVPTPTPLVFKAFATQNPILRPRSLVDVGGVSQNLDDLAAILRNRGNDLLRAAVSVSPAIADVLSAVEKLGPVFSGLSGSGATCFALFERLDDAASASAELGRSHPDWWRWSGGWA